MNRTDAPVKQSTPFAVNGQREPILPTTPAGDSTASYSDGFPPITMILKSAGGLPPKGQDMNQILFELSALARWASSGATNAWDAAFSTAIGGYPMGAVVLGTDGTTQYKNTVDSNTTNPNTGGAGWFNVTTGYLKTASNLGEIAAAGSTAVAAALANLGLKTAAQRDVGTGATQIPDMSSFTGAWTGGGGTPVVTGAGWRKGPDGVIEQWGVFGFGPDATGTDVVFPTPFPSRVESIILTFADIQETQLSPTTMPAIGVNSVGTVRTGFTARMSGSGGYNLFYMAMGR
ncbi:hypothetical protein EC843_101950 [Buttiauxella sp. JUb87]|uniref:gp53-like domain-containing protein n=1 Tax=Buttiauxella sp. JUb87 TaxID=2485129 RepID=UPI0010EB2C11|nr:phage tail protein [Buttiauxella sp. JUb87]TDN54891.1 hypothetical protein EC843_101950 [Buttiauxella sp. JUb87]